MAIFLTPFGYPFDGVAKLLSCGTPLQTCLSFAVAAPAKFETQKLEAGFPTTIATERHYPCLFRRQFQSKLPQTLCQLIVEVLCIFFPPEAADKVVCVSMQEGCASATLLKHFFKPQI